MSTEKIRRALEIRLSQMSPELATAYENVAFEPESGTPYQIVFMLYAEPDGVILGCGIRREIGIFQVTLMYPSDTAYGDCQARADAIRDWFPRGLSLSHDGQSVMISRHPSKITFGTEEDRYKVIVSIPFSADVIG